MERRRYLAAAGTTVAVGLGGCLGLTRGETNYDVGMRPSSFDPVEVTVAVGDEVVWENSSSRAHTVTAYEGSLPEGAAFFASGDYADEETAREAWQSSLGGGLENGEQFSHTFEVAGEYQYFCIPHEQGGMRGTVIVED